jgi:putative flavoprotein involved in K+ transport
MPRRYRGRDLVWWLAALGLDQTPIERRGPDKALPLITGAYGGHTIDFRELAQQGVVLIGHVKAAQDGNLDIAPDLAESLAHSDAAYTGFLDLVDAYVARNALDMPDDPAARAIGPDPPCFDDPIRRLDLRASAIGAVIWCTGYGVDFGWIDLPVLDLDGNPRHRRGITDLPGLYFLGLPWLSRMHSSFLSGVGQNAADLADHIAARRGRRRRALSA